MRYAGGVTHSERHMMSGEAFVRSPLGQALNSRFGRVIRVLAGLLIAGGGYMLENTTVGVALMIVGAIPFIAGILNVCVISALLGGPIDGEFIPHRKR